MVVPAPEIVEPLPQSRVPLTVKVPVLARVELLSASFVAAAERHRVPAVADLAAGDVDGPGARERARR